MIRTLIVAGLMVLAVPWLGAKTLYVSPQGTNNYAGFYPDWAGAATNLIEGVNRAASGDLVLVTNALYTLTNQVVIAAGVTVRSYNNGATDRTNTVIDGNWPNTINRCFLMYGSSTLDGFTVSNGCATTDSGGGGGIYMGIPSASQLGTATNCVIGWCRATNTIAPITYGGGVYIRADSSTGGGLANCVIRDNTAGSSGAGIYLFSPNGLHVSNCEIIGNQCLAAGGGGIHIQGGSKQLSVVGCTIVSNSNVASGGGGGGGLNLNCHTVVSNCLIGWNTSSLQGNGGGVCFAAGSPSIVNCTIVSNSAVRGGGIGFGSDARVKLVQNCRIIGNYASSYGGGVYVWQYGSSNVLRNCLIVRNTAGVAGGAVDTWGPSPGNIIENCTIAFNVVNGTTEGGGIRILAGVTGVVQNCIIWTNSTLNGESNWKITAPDTFTFTNCCTTPTNSLPGTGNINADPQFDVDQPANNYRLRNNSPCINAGFYQSWMDTATDLDGRPRIDRFGRKVDMGAYEFLNSGTMFICH